MDPTDDTAPDAVGPPVIPVVMLGITTVAAAAMVAGAFVEGAGDTDEIAPVAVLAWVVGAVVGLVVFAWFGSLDAIRRATGHYVDATWRPRTVAVVLAVTGWLIGSVGAFLVALALARR
ncbi:MAG: hypothetical protein MUE36_00845 [Acidimicrobiales bacterium]|nr:hypothetical protein [Acidimicrobiales bacterium]